MEEPVPEPVPVPEAEPVPVPEADEEVSSVIEHVEEEEDDVITSV